MSDAMLLSLIPVAAILGVLVARVLGRFLPGWLMVLAVAAYAVFLLDVALINSFLGIRYSRGSPNPGTDWSALGEAIAVIALGVPSLIGILIGWGWASAIRRRATEDDRA